jgi:hypothetical protein
LPLNKALLFIGLFLSLLLSHADASPPPLQRPEAYCLMVLRHYENLLGQLADSLNLAPLPQHAQYRIQLDTLQRRNPQCFSHSIGQSLYQIRKLLLPHLEAPPPPRTPQDRKKDAKEAEPPLYRMPHRPRLWWSVETGITSVGYEPSPQGGLPGTYPVAMTAWMLGGRFGVIKSGFFLTGDLFIGIGDASFNQQNLFSFQSIDSWMGKVGLTFGGFFGSFVLTLGISMVYMQMHDRGLEADGLFFPLEIGVGVRIPFGNFMICPQMLMSLAFDLAEQKGTYISVAFSVSFGAR